MKITGTITNNNINNVLIRYILIFIIIYLNLAIFNGDFNIANYGAKSLRLIKNIFEIYNLIWLFLLIFKK